MIFYKFSDSLRRSDGPFKNLSDNAVPAKRINIYYFNDF